MKIKVFALTLFMAAAAGHAQQAQPNNPEQSLSIQQPAQQVDQADRVQNSHAVPEVQPQATPRPQRLRESNKRDWSHYHEVWPGTVKQAGGEDPAVAERQQAYRQRQTGLDSVTKNVNPDDVNYGGLLALWRLEIVRDTIFKAEYWGVVCEGMLVVFLLLYIVWLRNQRAERFRITVDIVHQLMNSKAYARFHANRVINIHNALVRKLNDEYETKLRSGQAETDHDFLPEQVAIPQSVDKPADVKVSEPDDLKPHPGSQDDFSEHRTLPVVAAAKFGEELSNFDNRRRVSNPVETTLAAANAAASAEPPAQSEDLPEDKDTKIRRLESQVEAQSQRIRALRNNLNRSRQLEASGADDGGLGGDE